MQILHNTLSKYKPTAIYNLGTCARIFVKKKYPLKKNCC